MVQIAKSRPGIRKLYFTLSPQVRAFFRDIPALVASSFSLDIILAYVFFRLEQGQHQALFCGARKLHKTDKDVTRRALDVHYMTRDDYLEFFKKIFGFKIDKQTADSIRAAQKIRDRLMHGKTVNAPQRREAISRVLDYAERVNKLVASKHGLGFRPFDADLRGFTGRLESLDKSTSRWILKGIGFSLQ